MKLVESCCTLSVVVVEDVVVGSGSLASVDVVDVDDTVVVV